MKRELILTNDGSSTIRINDLNENYHSGHGAIQEAMHVFIQNGLGSISSSSDLPIRVFEMGLGTGLNALLSYQYAKENAIEIIYLGIEAYPVEKELYSKLNYIERIGVEYVDFFHWMHDLKWGVHERFDDHFSLEKIHQDLSKYNPELSIYDLVYYDAFGPRAQSEMWELNKLEKMFSLLKPNGKLITYCAQGQFKRNLKQIGFDVVALPGPPGKREMTVAIKL
ncbi:MAG: SAM-dependent methyltransferase [Bacteroidetes bacterium]|nr:MAG: SAM-dependent methyltransferase [Bacteroidota bacterium]